jgi:hypothetical protein
MYEFWKRGKEHEKLNLRLYSKNLIRVIPAEGTRETKEDSGTSGVFFY